VARQLARTAIRRGGEGHGGLRHMANLNKTMEGLRQRSTEAAPFATIAGERGSGATLPQ
jgi:hypothetical protein